MNALALLLLSQFLWSHFFICFASKIQMFDKDKNPPEDCNMNLSEALDSYEIVEDFECCAPYLLPEYARLYIQSGAGRQVTLRENKLAYCRYRILPKMLRDVSNVDLSVMVLGQRISMPIAAAPTAYHRLASDDGELDTVRAISEARTLMVLSSFSSTFIEDVARSAGNARLWMQVYIYPDRSQTVNLIRRAEAAGFKAIVVTIDSPILGPFLGGARDALQSNPKNVTSVNLFTTEFDDPSITFKDLRWVKSLTKLPIVVKGVLTAADAVQAIESGASAIVVSNHGGRQLDFTPATIDVLPKIAEVVKRRFPHIGIFVDGGIRNGFDVFKALALGADLCFIGRPIFWGLAAGEQRGVSKVLNILRRELNETMTLAGTPNVLAIDKNMVTYASAVNEDVCFSRCKTKKIR